MSEKYMNQYLFDQGLAVALRLWKRTGRSPFEIASLMAREYKNAFPGDPLAGDWSSATFRLIDELKEVLLDPQADQLLDELREWVGKHNPDGTVRGWRLLDGTFFNSSNSRGGRVENGVTRLIEHALQLSREYAERRALGTHPN